MSKIKKFLPRAKRVITVLVNELYEIITNALIMASLIMLFEIPFHNDRIPQTETINYCSEDIHV